MAQEAYKYFGSGEFAPHQVGVKERYYEIPDEALLQLQIPIVRESWMDEVGLIGTVTISPPIMVHDFDQSGKEITHLTDSFPPQNDLGLGGLIVAKETVPLNLPELIRDRIRSGKFKVTEELAQYISLR